MAKHTDVEKEAKRENMDRPGCCWRSLWNPGWSVHVQLVRSIYIAAACQYTSNFLIVVTEAIIHGCKRGAMPTNRDYFAALGWSAICGVVGALAGAAMAEAAGLTKIMVRETEFKAARRVFEGAMLREGILEALPQAVLEFQVKKTHADPAEIHTALSVVSERISMKR
eukprot:SAG31_NODE_806_length_11957_cov_2.232670_8_plen_168_part_00